MKLAFIVLAHRLPRQLASLLSVLQHPQVRVYLHIDRRRPLTPFTREFAGAGLHDVVLLRRYATRSASAEIVDATLEGVASGVADGCEYFVLLSGMDFPLRPVEEIVSFFERPETESYISYLALADAAERLGPWHGRYRTDFYTYDVRGRREVCLPRGEDIGSLSWKGKMLNQLLRMRSVFKPPRRHPAYVRPFMGSQWWNLSRPAALYILRFVSEHPDFRRYHAYTFCPDDMFFHSILLGTGFSSEHRVINESLRFLIWPQSGDGHPSTLTMEHLPAMLESGELFARKFDATVDETVLAQLEQRVTTG